MSKHVRSEFAQQRREAKRFIMNTAFHDSILAESVSRVSYEHVIEFLGERFKGVIPGAARVERGEVLLDSRGRGSYQMARK